MGGKGRSNFPVTSCCLALTTPERCRKGDAEHTGCGAAAETSGTCQPEGQSAHSSIIPSTPGLAPCICLKATQLTVPGSTPSSQPCTPAPVPPSPLFTLQVLVQSLPCTSPHVLSGEHQSLPHGTKPCRRNSCEEQEEGSGPGGAMVRKGSLRR